MSYGGGHGGAGPLVNEGQRRYGLLENMMHYATMGPALGQYNTLHYQYGQPVEQPNTPLGWRALQLAALSVGYTALATSTPIGVLGSLPLIPIIASALGFLHARESHDGLSQSQTFLQVAAPLTLGAYPGIWLGQHVGQWIDNDETRKLQYLLKNKKQHWVLHALTKVRQDELNQQVLTPANLIKNKGLAALQQKYSHVIGLTHRNNQQKAEYQRFKGEKLEVLNTYRASVNEAKKELLLLKKTKQQVRELYRQTALYDIEKVRLYQGKLSALRTRLFNQAQHLPSDQLKEILQRLESVQVYLGQAFNVPNPAKKTAELFNPHQAQVLHTNLLWLEKTLKLEAQAPKCLLADDLHNELKPLVGELKELFHPSRQANLRAWFSPEVLQNRTRLLQQLKQEIAHGISCFERPTIEAAFKQMELVPLTPGQFSGAQKTFTKTLLPFLEKIKSPWVQVSTIGSGALGFFIFSSVIGYPLVKRFNHWLANTVPGWARPKHPPVTPLPTAPQPLALTYNGQTSVLDGSLSSNSLAPNLFA